MSNLWWHVPPPQNNCNYWKKNLARSRSSHQGCSIIKGVLRNFAKFARNTCARACFFNKIAGRRPMACNFIKKETLTRVFSCEFCKIFKNAFFTEHLRTTASADYMWVKNYSLPIKNKFLNQLPCLGVQSQIAITKRKIIEKCLISDYPKIQTFIKIEFMLKAVQLIICHPKSWYVQTILKRRTLILAGNVRMNCTIKAVK